MRLGVNIDHVATLRQARGTEYPDPVAAALLCERAGCDSVVAHLREDRRHIQDRDVYQLKESLTVPFNLEMSAAPSILRIALDLRPAHATLVPEKRRELTTEGGLDLAAHPARIGRAVRRLRAENIQVSLFLDPVQKQIRLAAAMGVEIIELNTGKYSDTRTVTAAGREAVKIEKAAGYARAQGLTVAAGHGLDYLNVSRIAAIPSLSELNIGHSIICRAVFTGIVPAVEEMKALTGEKIS
ncbi:MAG: pyridoxine 5'-phosphate synthase [Candidatus Omnitrophica bacterium]|nr:pyridoxine 5'-phosphate synthase [Candidatus Omnitrophota bacterium]